VNTAAAIANVVSLAQQTATIVQAATTGAVDAPMPSASVPLVAPAAQSTVGLAETPPAQPEPATTDVQPATPVGAQMPAAEAGAVAAPTTTAPVTATPAADTTVILPVPRHDGFVPARRRPTRGLRAPIPLGAGAEPRPTPRPPLPETVTIPLAPSSQAARRQEAASLPTPPTLQSGDRHRRAPALLSVLFDSGADFAPLAGGHAPSGPQHGDALTGLLLLFLAVGLAYWLWVLAEGRPRGLRAGRPERPG